MKSRSLILKRNMYLLLAFNEISLLQNFITLCFNWNFS